MLKEAQAETAAALAFLYTEMEWEYFRLEFMHLDDEKKGNSSAENARRLKNYLAQKGHGIGILKELERLKKENLRMAKQDIILGN
jgi:hypothetical protein